jgi:hypothetical protein
VQTHSGKTYVDETLYRPGGIEDPMPASDLERKFMDLASGIIGAAQASECLARINTLEHEPHVRIFGG